MKDTVRSFIDSFYKDFFQRDFLGFLMPGYLVLLSICWWQKDYLFNETNNIPAYLKGFLLFLSIGVAYLTGFAVQQIGIRCGIVRYYPFCETKKEFHVRMDNFKKHFSDNFAHLAQRERYVALKQSSGNTAISLFLCAFFLKLGHIEDSILLFILIIGFILVIAHLETVYNQRSFEWTSLHQENNNDTNDPRSGLIESFFSSSLIDWLLRIFKKCKRND